MGRYINITSTGKELSWRKAQELINDGAKQIPEPSVWNPNLVCVVDNGVFEADVKNNLLINLISLNKTI